jgi:hypothetical protein
MAAHRELVHAVVSRAKLRGEVVFDVDDDLAADMIFGPILFRLLNGHAPLDENFAFHLVDTAVAAMRYVETGMRRAAEAAE